MEEKVEKEVEINEVEETRDEEVVGILEWIIFQIVLMIPIVNIIMAIIWLLSPNTKKSKKNLILSTIVLFFLGGLVSLILMTAIGIF